MGQWNPWKSKRTLCLTRSRRFRRINSIRSLSGDQVIEHGESDSGESEKEIGLEDWNQYDGIDLDAGGTALMKIKLESLRRAIEK